MFNIGFDKTINYLTVEKNRLMTFIFHKSYNETDLVRKSKLGLEICFKFHFFMHGQMTIKETLL